MWAIRGSLFLGMILLRAEPIIVDSPKEITAEWESRVLGVRHGVVNLVDAVQEMTEGLVDSYFGKEFIDKLREAITKNQSGEYIEYWENGALKVKLPYKNGKPDGHLPGWYDNGRDAFKGFFKEGIKQGTHITFFRTEPREHAKKAYIHSYSENGLLNGGQETYHPTGDLWIVIEYENGRAEGPLEGWDIKGNEIISADYKNGILKKNPPPPPPQRKRPKMQVDEKYVNEVIKKFEREAAEEFMIVATGSGGGMPFDVERISVDFTAVRRATIEDARRLVIALKEKLADAVNQHEKLRPYLREYPFSPLRAEVSLRFCQKDGRSYTDGSVCSVIVGKGDKIYYLTENPNTHKREDLFVEPYEEAVKIVKAKGDKICVDTSTN